MFTQVEKVLDEKIRPALAQHGGNVQVIDIDNDVVFVKLTGGCQGCSSSKATLSGGIEQVIKKEFPEIKDVIDLTDHATGQNPYM
jgi:Fe-S cluster biogenesis protein NfuA